MRLSEFQQRNRNLGAAQTGRGGTGTLEQNQEQAGTIRNAVAYTHPINAFYQGRAVTLLATGDIVGMSPSEKFVDEDGRLDWAPSEDFIVDDRHVIPMNAETRQRLQQQHNKVSAR